MAKIQDLALYLSKKHKIQQKEAERFLTAMVDVLNDGLHYEKLVKVKGLGTFKVIEVKNRESVNVNTGERILIEGRPKITFTPDAVMKDLVNKPFAQFETVVLNEGVTFDNLPEEPEVELKEEPEPQPEIEQLMEETPAAETGMGEVAALADVSNVGDELQSGKEPEEEEPILKEEEDIEDPVELPSEEPENVAKDDSEEQSDVKSDVKSDEKSDEVHRERYFVDVVDDSVKMERHHTNSKSWIWWLVGMAAVGTIMYFVGYHFGKQDIDVMQVSHVVVEDSIAEESAPAKVDSAAIKAEAEKAAAAAKMKADSIAKQEAYAKAEAAKKAAYEAEVKKQKEEAAAAAAVEAKASDSKDLANARNIVKTGAYTIIGTQESVIVKKGQTLEKISKAYLGPGMEAYVKVHNGVTEAKEGSKLKIPKLQVKKKR
jgi:nucleoid DNA-binding protein